METLSSKILIYDNTCPLCSAYTGAFIKAGALCKNGRLSFSRADDSVIRLLDVNRARHEIPLIDKNTGQVLYGLEALVFIVANRWPFTAALITSPVFKKAITPLYKFISYNRKVIAGTASPLQGFNCTPDFNFWQRALLILTGVSLTLGGILGFAFITNLSNIPRLVAMVFLYFLLLMATNIFFNGTAQQKWDYLGHLSVLGIIESALFLLTTLLAKAAGLPALLFVAQGCVRLFALSLHIKRVKNNGYSPLLNYAFGLGALGMVIYLAVVMK